MALAAAGLASGPVLPSILLVRQRQAPAALLAQISTTGASLKIGAYAVGAALGGALAPRLGAAATLGAVAGTQLAAAALGWLAGVRPHRLPVRTRGMTPWPPRPGPQIGRQPRR